MESGVHSLQYGQGTILCWKGHSLNPELPEILYPVRNGCPWDQNKPLF